MSHPTTSVTRYLITGATGNVGARVVERLLARGERPAIFARDAEKARARFGDRVEVLVGDFGDAASMARALKGVDVLFLVTSGPDLERHDAAAAKVAKASGVKRIVKLSSADAASRVGTGVWHARGESAIREAGVPFVFVRPTGFMDNALFWARSIKTQGVVRSSTGEGKIPFIHSDDIADVATLVLTSALATSEYEGQALPITGPEALSYGEMGVKIGAAIGKPIAYEAISDEEVRRIQTAWDAEAVVIEAHISIYRAIREGRLAEVTPNVQRLLGRRAIDFDTWTAQHADAFR
jgi:uncharacterized protein YbjT (DUF2867 family)